MNCAVLLSGGTGNRISSSIPKQYIRGNKYMMVTLALAPLLNCVFIDQVCIVAEPEWRDPIIRDAEIAGLNTGRIACFASPGRNRQESVLNGMEAILSSCDSSGSPEQAPDSVLIHDAARPFLKIDLLGRCYEALSGHDGVMPVLPMKDTVYRSEDGKRITQLLERREIFAGQAPELFGFHKYYKANTELLPDRILNINGASEPAVLAGMDIVMIPGDESNIKITTYNDLARFRQMMDGRSPLTPDTVSGTDK